MHKIEIIDLKKGNYYYIESKDDPFCRQIGRFSRYNTFHKNNNVIYYIAVFDQIHEIIKEDGTTGNSGLCSVPPLENAYRHNVHFSFYEIKKKEILKKQEKKLINNCLKKITNDIYFTWY